MVTGEFRAVTRNRIERMIATYGGRKTGSVSGNTDYLIAGYMLDDGRPTSQSKKYRDALIKGTKILTEKEFEKFIRDRTGNQKYELS